MNDDEDMDTTMESIKTAEKMTGKQLNQIESSVQNAKRTGSYVHNFLEDDHRIYTSELDNALVDKDIAEQKARADKQAAQQKATLAQQKAKQEIKREQKARDDVAIHFMDDDF